MIIWERLPGQPAGILSARPDIHVRTDRLGKWVIAAQLSCAEGCPIEAWKAEIPTESCR